MKLGKLRLRQGAELPALSLRITFLGTQQVSIFTVTNSMACVELQPLFGNTSLAEVIDGSDVVCRAICTT